MQHQYPIGSAETRYVITVCFEQVPSEPGFQAFGLTSINVIGILGYHVPHKPVTS